jgi:hypothetical protein
MNNIELKKGLIAIGSGIGEGKTRFSLKLANFIARTENVLYISYKEHKEKLIEIIQEIDGKLNDKLDINTRFAYFGSEVFLDIIKYVKTKNITTVFIDDIETFCSISLEETSLEETKYNIIEDLKYISEMLSIKLIFLTNTIKHKFDERYYPVIKNFRWSRAINNECSQILAFYKPSAYGFTEDENGNYLYDKIELHFLKNSGDEKEFIFDNKEEKIFKYKHKDFLKRNDYQPTINAEKNAEFSKELAEQLNDFFNE